MVDSENVGLLDSIRVLDLTDEKGYLRGKMLGDLGADIIKIERLGGDPGRRFGPFFQDIIPPEKSIDWFAYSTNKRAIHIRVEFTAWFGLLQKCIMSTDGCI